MQVEEEHAAGVRRVWRPHYRRLPVKQVVTDLGTRTNQARETEKSAKSEPGTRKKDATVGHASPVNTLKKSPHGHFILSGTPSRTHRSCRTVGRRVLAEILELLFSREQVRNIKLGARRVQAQKKKSSHNSAQVKKK